MATTSTRSGPSSSVSAPPRCSCRPPRRRRSRRRAGRTLRGLLGHQPGERRVPSRTSMRCRAYAGAGIARVPDATRAIPSAASERERMVGCRPWTLVLLRARTRRNERAPTGNGNGASRRVISSACATCPASTGCARSRSPASCSTTPTSNWIPGGFLGVDVFFVISGYLITSLLLAEFRNHGQDQPRPVLPAPRAAPAARAVPACSASSACSRSCSSPTRSRSCAATSSPRSLYGTNWWQIFRNVSYFEAAGRPPMLQHLWSLAVEEQFYLIWPLMLTGMFRLWHGRRRPMLLATLGDHRGVVGADDRPVDQPRLPDRPRPVARLLRHRHARVHDAHRRGARDGVGAVAALGADDAAAGGSCLDAVGLGGLARAHVDVPQRERVLEHALPRRLPALRACWRRS